MRNIIQNKFISGEVKMIVSTIAFGMGIDQTVRCVIIFGAPSSIEEYYQQIGRAGRDNKEAETVLYFQYKGIKIGEANLTNYKNLKDNFNVCYRTKLPNKKDLGYVWFYLIDWYIENQEFNIDNFIQLHYFV